MIEKKHFQTTLSLFPKRSIRVNETAINNSKQYNHSSVLSRSLVEVPMTLSDHSTENVVESFLNTRKDSASFLELLIWICLYRSIPHNLPQTQHNHYVGVWVVHTHIDLVESVGGSHSTNCY